jgi:tetratricopeptide (TPR) repeat protein
MWCVVIAVLASAAPRPTIADASDSRGEYGVTLAMTGEEARAESIFVTMLSHTHGDARALNNLGNLRLLRGETGVALAFYDRALRGDSLDPGIHLNRATALMVLGDTQRSQQAFALGVRLAGSVEKAQALLGLPPEKQPTDRAAQKTAIDAEQLRAMLKQAASAVPKDSVGVKETGTASTAGKHTSAWRSAGTRASDGSETTQLLYWKR